MKTEIQEILEKNIRITDKGRLADYIPALNKKENQNDLGLSIIDSDDKLLACGDYNKKFTIQSISKVVTLLLAIKDQGVDRVFNKVGYEGTDEPFNTFIKLDITDDSKPANPMINSGALAITSLIHGGKNDRFTRILDFLREITKNPDLNYNEEIYLSELETCHRNRAIAYLLKSKGIIEGNVEDIIDDYCKQCSIEVNTIDLAYIGKYISSGSSGEDVTRIIKGILLGCGMYDYSTEYSIKVGIPSKSGVGGGIMGVLPKNMGIGVYGPALDVYGNSIGGIGILKDISSKYDYNIFNKY